VESSVCRGEDGGSVAVELGACNTDTLVGGCIGTSG
jgi:hypothetical protein